MSEPTVVREWNADTFHRRVLELEAQGYTTRLETYDIRADMNPGTGEVTHLYTIEMFGPNKNSK